MATRPKTDHYDQVKYNEERLIVRQNIRKWTVAQISCKFSQPQWDIVLTMPPGA